MGVPGLPSDQEKNGKKPYLSDDIKRLLSSNPIDAASPEWVKSAEARRILKASPGTLQNLRVSGKLNPVKIAGTWYYNSQEIVSLFVKK
jgi:hypothetical protein